MHSILVAVTRPVGPKLVLALAVAAAVRRVWPEESTRSSRSSRPLAASGRGALRMSQADPAVAATAATALHAPQDAAPILVAHTLLWAVFVVPHAVVAPPATGGRDVDRSDVGVHGLPPGVKR
jgi:hypothetical protein